MPGAARCIRQRCFLSHDELADLNAEVGSKVQFELMLSQKGQPQEKSVFECSEDRPWPKEEDGEEEEEEKDPWTRSRSTG